MTFELFFVLNLLIVFYELEIEGSNFLQKFNRTRSTLRLHKYEKYQCVPMPRNVSFCHNGFYSQGRLPNIMGTWDVLKIKKKLDELEPLVNTECHWGML